MISELIEELKDLADIERENVKLRDELAEEKEKYLAAKQALSEMQDTISNYTGALRRYEHEIHVLYHKASTLLKYRHTELYKTSVSDDKNRKGLQEVLDTIEPTGIEFTSNKTGMKSGEKYTLEKYGTLAGMSVNYVNQYPEQQIAFC